MYNTLLSVILSALFFRLEFSTLKRARPVCYEKKFKNGDGREVGAVKTHRASGGGCLGRGARGCLGHPTDDVFEVYTDAFLHNIDNI